MSQHSLIESYLAATRRLLRLSPAEADRVLAEMEDHLSLAVLEGVERGLSLREAEEQAVTRFGLPGEVCDIFRQVYHPWYLRPMTAMVGAVLGGLILMNLSPVLGIVPMLLGFLPAYFRRSASAGVLPGLAACAVSGPLWIWCALVNPGWYQDAAGRPPADAIGMEVVMDLAVMVVLLLQVAAGAVLGARIGHRRDARLA